MMWMECEESYDSHSLSKRCVDLATTLSGLLDASSHLVRLVPVYGGVALHRHANVLLVTVVVRMYVYIGGEKGVHWWRVERMMYMVERMMH
jgi:hypothetical protein